MRRILTSPARFLRRSATAVAASHIRLVPILSAVAGLGLGLVLALPPRDMKGQCPPANEGLVNCMLQKQWLPVAMIVVTTAVAAVLLAELVVSAPSIYRRAKRGELFGRGRHHTTPPFDSDGVLVAACWGATYEEPAPQRNPWHGRPTRHARADEPAPRTPESDTATPRLAQSPPSEPLAALATADRATRVAAIAIALDMAETPVLDARTRHQYQHQL